MFKSVYYIIQSPKHAVRNGTSPYVITKRGILSFSYKYVKDKRIVDEISSFMSIDSIPQKLMSKWYSLSD